MMRLEWCLVLALATACGNAGVITGDDEPEGTLDAAAVEPAPDAAPVPGPVDAAPVDTCPSGQTRCIDGTTLETCENGLPIVTDYASIGATCEVAAGGFACQATGIGGNVVSGKILYEDREPQSSGALGGIAPKPARGVSVSLVADVGGTVLATGRTADDGSYSLPYTVDAGTMVHVLAATTSDVGTRPLKVTKTNGSVHGFGSASFATGGNVQRDVLITEASKEAEAFNVFDMMVIGADVVRTRMGVATIEPIVAIWQNGSSDGTYYDGSLHLLGSSSDDDGYDDAVILHEFGHYVEAVYGGTDSPGGSHNGSAVDPRLGWSEGWATYFSSSARGNRFYMDSNSGGGFGDDLEVSVTMANAGGSMSQNVSENMVSQMLWDVGDGPPGDDDPRSGGDRHEDVMKIEVQYLRAGIGQARGVNGVDLVDWLDGWFKQQGLSTCAALRSIAQKHQFPYDFSAPGAACP